jgi:protein disulfide-isomerase
MKKYLLGIFCVCVALGMVQVGHAADYYAPSDHGSVSTMNGIQWETNYQKAVRMAQEQNKPILLLFTGSDWCTWCIRLEKEVFASPSFVDRMKDKFIYVKLDYPNSSKPSADIVAQNKALKAKFKVQGFPSVVILNSREDKIGSLGYQAGGPVKYSQTLLDIIGQR